MLDFESQEDSLLFVWDDSGDGAEEPQISVVRNPEDEGQLQIVMGSQVMATLRGNSLLEAADISLIPLSTAQGLGFLG
ncbi:hypothetical protein ACFQFQ_19520 [Sulfitobacter porphyrae]|uniref:Uncharacterized protein n=1 Tax=Sulfitobacter porphyrae TaxID=1246864 RepID=A0ABW2B7I1_9RHOB